MWLCSWLAWYFMHSPSWWLSGIIKSPVMWTWGVWKCSSSASWSSESVSCYVQFVRISSLCLLIQPKYRCECHEGWRSDGVTPQCTLDIDECSNPLPPCSTNPAVQCFNSPGSYHCGPCPTGADLYCFIWNICGLQNFKFFASLDKERYLL